MFHRPVIRKLLVAWLTACLMLSALGLFNIWVAQTPTWLDVIWISVTTIIVARLADARELHNLFNKRWAGFIGVVGLVCAVLVGIGYAAQGLIGNATQPVLGGPLSVVVNTIKIWVDRPVNEAFQNFRRGSALSAMTLFRLSPIVLDMATLVTVLAGAMSTLSRPFHLYWLKIRGLIYRAQNLMHVRPGRLVHGLSNALRGLGAILIGLYGLAAVANANTSNLQRIGESLTAFTGPTVPPTIMALVWDGKTLYAGTYGGGIFKTSDGGNKWEAANAGLSNTSVGSLVWNGKTLYAGTNGGGVFKTSDGGNKWEPANTGLNKTNVRSLVWDGRTLYAGTYGGGVFKTSDGGNKWEPASTGLGNTNVQSLVWDGRTLYCPDPGKMA